MRSIKNRLAISLCLLLVIGLEGPPRAFAGGEKPETGFAVASNLEVKAAVLQLSDEFFRESGLRSRVHWFKGPAPRGEALKAHVIIWQEWARRKPAFDNLLQPGTERPLGTKKLCLLLAQGNPKGISKLSDLLKPSVHVALPGKKWGSLWNAVQHLLSRTASGAAIRRKAALEAESAEELIRHIKGGTADAALGWNVLEGLAPTEVDAVALPEDMSIKVSIKAALTRSGAGNRNAAEFLDFLSLLTGQAVLGRYGYDVKLHHAGADSYHAFVQKRLKKTYLLTARRFILESGITKGICLDIGCGSGELEIALARISDLKIIGVDIDPSMIELAKKQVRAAGLSARISFVAADVHDLPFKDRFADLVVSRGSLIFWKDKVKALREIYRVLKPGGYALLGGRYLFTPPAYKVSLKELQEIVRRTGIKNARVVSARGQWVEMWGPQWKRPASNRNSRMGLLAGRILIDYGISKGDCVVIERGLAGLERELLRLGDFKVTVVLPTEKAKQAAEKALSASPPYRQIKVVCAQASKLPFPEGSVDLVVSVGALPFWKDKAAVFREVWRILKPGGIGFLGGRYRFMPKWRRVSTGELRKIAKESGVPHIRVIEDRGQWVEIRKTP